MLRLMSDPEIRMRNYLESGCITLNITAKINNIKQHILSGRYRSSILRANKDTTYILLIYDNDIWENRGPQNYRDTAMYNQKKYEFC